MNRTVEASGIYSIDDLKESASKKLPKFIGDYYNEGAMDLITLKENCSAFDQYRIRPRILVDVAKLDMSRTLWGRKCAFPLGLSPSAFHGLAHPEGEIATSRAASKSGIPMALSTYSTRSVEDVVAAGRDLETPYAMQLSVMRSREANLSIISRAEKAGCKAVFVTVDCAVLGRRLNEAKNDFKIPQHISLPNLPGDLDWRAVDSTDDRLKYDAALSWKTLVEWARENTKLEIWLKGVYTAEDVTLAVDHGIDGVIVSNHGGRQLDSVTATLDALPECVAAASGRIPVHIDGGFRRGTDIFKALALGADFCWIGRPVLWGLAHDGEKGVMQAIKLLKDEFEVAMSLSGCANVEQITRSHLARRGPDGRMAKL